MTLLSDNYQGRFSAGRIPLKNRVVPLLSGLLILSSCALALADAGGSPSLQDSGCHLAWIQGSNGWQLNNVSVQSGSGALPVGKPSGQYTFLFSEETPSTTESAIPDWIGRKDDLIPAALNTAGDEHTFYPESAKTGPDGSWIFAHEDDAGQVTATWALDPKFPGDICVTLTLTAKKAGWFSMASPTLAIVDPNDLKWAVVPGYFEGAAIQPNFSLAFGYGQGLPDRPVVARERDASTLDSVMTTKEGATLAVVAAPGVGTDPWENDHDTRAIWRLGLSHMNRQGALTPTLYNPILGQDGSHLDLGQAASFQFRYSLRSGDWFDMQKHVIYDIYHFADFLALKQTPRSLTDRLLALRRYVEDDRTSLWRVEDFNGLKIGAQSYLGFVSGANHDAMKNSDLGAMWMLGALTADPSLTQDRLPYARNFKLAQQQTDPGFFQGAATGQYYLAKSHRFAEEDGGYVEPIGLTYYTIIDDGNILLFEPGDTELRDRLRLGADRLLSWQRTDGSWEVAYDHQTEQPTFTQLSDLRPTFYGMLVAYRILGDQKYLQAARQGADWLITHAVVPGGFTGVCGDTHFAPDFATGQIAQGMLDLYDITHDDRYRQAAIATARFYTTSIFTHPIASTFQKSVKGEPRQDWEINQSGLSFEHGGTIGSANTRGPILLASHAGLFIRMYGLTGETLFRDMARAGALGRDAFVDPTGVASYYYSFMNKGPGPFPQHAWWQIGWIMDYLISEAGMRLHDKVTFPRGFFTPKVGPHGTYGFAPGKVEGKDANLVLNEGLVTLDSTNVDYLTAQAPSGGSLFVILLNEQTAPASFKVTVDPAKISPNGTAGWKTAKVIDADGHSTDLAPMDGHWNVSIPGFGASVLILN